MSQIDVGLLRDTGLDSHHGNRTVDPDDIRLVDLRVDTLGRPRRNGVLRRLFARKVPESSIGRSLRSGIAENRCSPLALIGEAGAGKSVSLQRLARHLLRQGQRAWGGRCLLPLYVHLGRLDLSPSAEPSAADIRAYVIDQVASVGGQRSERIASAVADWFDWGVKRRRWLLLLDAFDEIPALIEHTATPRTSAAYAQSIVAFARNCQGATTLVATRPLPGLEDINWTSWHLQPLNAPEQQQVLSAWFPRRTGRRQVQQELAEQAGLPGSELTNPLILTLVAGFRAHRDSLPKSLPEAFGDFVARRLSRLADEIQDTPSADILGRAAAWVAARILVDQIRGVSHDWASLANALNVAGWDLEVPVAEALQWLYLAKLARIEGTGEPRQRRFEFFHRRMLEYFALRGVLDKLDVLPLHPSGDPREPVSLAELMTAEAWREVAVGVLASTTTPGHERFAAAVRQRIQDLEDTVAPAQPTDPELVDLLASEASQPGAAEVPRTPFRWPEGALGLLDIVQRAKDAAGVSDAPTARAADQLLFAAWRRGDESERVDAMSVARAGSAVGVAALLAAGFKEGKWLLRSRCFDQALRLPVLPPPLLAPVREALVARWVTKTPNPGSPRAMHRRLLRLDPSAGLSKSFRLLRVFRRIDRLWYLGGTLFVFMLSVGVGLHSYFYSGLDCEMQGVGRCLDALAMPFGIVALIYWPLIAASLLKKGNIYQGMTWIDDISCGSRTMSNCFSRGWLIPVGLSRGLQVAWFFVAYWFLLNGASVHGADGEVKSFEPLSSTEALVMIGVPWLLSIIGLVWGFCAPLAAMSGRLLEIWKWPLLPVLPLLLLPAWFKRDVRAPRGRRLRRPEPGVFVWIRGSLALNGIFILLGIFFLAQMRLRGDWFDWIVVPTSIAIAIPLFVLELMDVIPCLKVEASRQPFKANTLVDLGSRRFVIEGERGRHRELQWGMRSPRLTVDRDAEPFVDGVIRAITRDARRLAESPRCRSLRLWWQTERPPVDDGWPAAVQDWYRTYARRGSGVAYLDGLLLHDFIGLRDLCRIRLAAAAT